ncbi:MAG: hypothetical protein K0B11_20485 [Mariniphaga sp.]|nr:hypothetical protein [Mariniphaga sp.]
MRQLKITKQITDRNDAALGLYLQEISKIKLLTTEEEVELARRIKEQSIEKLKIRQHSNKLLKEYVSY